MTSLRRACVVFTLLVSAPARAVEPNSPSSSERASLSLTMRAGLVEAPFVTTAFPRVSGFGTLLTARAAARFASLGSVHLTLPISIVRLDFPARAQVAETTLGNLELGFAHPFPLAPTTRLDLCGALLAPTAQHGSSASLLENRALALTNALHAGKDAALLTPGVVGLRVGGSVEHEQQPFTFRASLDLPLLVRISDASLPRDTQTRSVGLLPSLELRAAVRVKPWFAASLSAALVTEPLRVQEPNRERDGEHRVQPVIEPAVHFWLGRHVTLGLDGSVPVAGTLGGKAWSVGVVAGAAL